LQKEEKGALMLAASHQYPAGKDLILQLGKYSPLADIGDLRVDIGPLL
jgi:hypothetical protein